MRIRTDESVFSIYFMGKRRLYGIKIRCLKIKSFSGDVTLEITKSVSKLYHYKNISTSLNLSSNIV